MRLAFAIQVVLVHTAEHLRYSIPNLVSFFPGVPAFFFVSGFLIYASYQNAPGKVYFQNRFLRLFPGLVFVTIGGATVALVAHGRQDLSSYLPTYAVWFVAQITLGQAYNPSLFRDVGVGVINGSLWTLTTEILFYVSVPAIVWMERRHRFAIPALLALSFGVFAVGPLIWYEPVLGDKTFFDFIALTPIVWGWMFGFGMLAVKHFDVVRSYLRYFPLGLVSIALMIPFGAGPIFGPEGNRLGFVYFASYAALVLWFAFATPPVRLKTDLSYGIYVWHMPVINMQIVLSRPSFALAFAFTFAAAMLSWTLVEKPFLRLKRRSLRPVVDQLSRPE